jgi:ribonuclease-3
MLTDVIELKLGYKFKDGGLLRQALTHRSQGTPNNERLEFLGDSVLNCVVARLLFERFTTLAEGDLSRVRANLVNQQSLFDVASELELGQHIMLGQGELRSGGAGRPSILADTLEAIFGAVFLDAGFEAAAAVISASFESVISTLDPAAVAKDPKTQLQELLQGKRMPLPAYSVVSVSGPAHDQSFRVECLIAGMGIQAFGEGTSRRAAEQDAAQHAIDSAATADAP